MTEILCQREENKCLKEMLKFKNFMLGLSIIGLLVMTAGFIWAANI